MPQLKTKKTKNQFLMERTVFGVLTAAGQWDTTRVRGPGCAKPGRVSKKRQRWMVGCYTEEF